MSKIKLVLAFFVLAAGIAGVVVVSLLVSANQVNKDVKALKAWEVPEGTALERLKKKSKKLGEIREVLKHKEDAVAPLMEAMKAWGPEECAGVMMALAMLEAKEGIPPILEILKNQEGTLGYVSAACLGHYEDKAVPALKDASSGMAELPAPVRMHLYQAMAWTREDSMEELLAQGLKDPDESVAVAVAELLDIKRNEVLVAPLLESLASDSPALSKASVNPLVNNKKHLKAKQLEKHLKSKKEHVRANAATVLGYFERVFASRIVLPLLEDASPAVIVAASEALLMMGENVKPDTLLPLLEATEPEVVETASSVLKKIGASAAKAKFNELLDSKQAHTRKAAAMLLGTCAKSQPGNLLEEPHIPKLIEMLLDKDLVETAANTLRLWTGVRSLDNGHGEWKKWWERYSERKKRENEAEQIYTTIKTWLGDGTIHEEGKAEKAVEMIQRAKDLYQEIIDANLSSHQYDGKFVKLNSLLRRAQTHLGN